jgi:hypothetical protein
VLFDVATASLYEFVHPDCAEAIVASEAIAKSEPRSRLIAS